MEFESMQKNAFAVFEASRRSESSRKYLNRNKTGEAKSICVGCEYYSVNNVTKNKNKKSCKQCEKSVSDIHLYSFCYRKGISKNFKYMKYFFNKLNFKFVTLFITC